MRRGHVIRPDRLVNPQGEDPVSTGKAFDISKRLVWDAYQDVRRNAGSAGVDGQCMEAFEANLKNNLYKIWNRLCSGSYMPPPVLRVEIPKADGGVRQLGILTIVDAHRAGGGQAIP